MGFSVESKSCGVLSLAIAVTFALFSAVDATTTSTITTTSAAVLRRCSLQASGTLTMFNQETTVVKVPCKYRLADFTCGDYRVKVTPGSIVDAQGGYSHFRAWVKVVNTATNETVKLRITTVRLEKAVAGEIRNPWKLKEGSTAFLDFAGTIGGFAVLSQNGTYTVWFTRNLVEVFCVAPEFSSRGMPETLCGDGSTVDEVNTARMALLGDTDLDVEQFLQYIILNDNTVTQSVKCVDLTSNFQRCDSKVPAVQRCSHYFSNATSFECLYYFPGGAEDAYDSCVRQTCYNDSSNAPLGNC